MSRGRAAPADELASEAERASESLMRQLEQLAAGWPADEQAELASEIDRQQVTEANCYARSNSAATTGSQLRIFRGDDHEHQHGN